MATTPASYNNGFQLADMKQQNRFIMRLTGTPIQSWFVRTSDLPSVENNPVVVDTINSDYKIKGKSRWQDISVTFYDPVGNTTSTGVNTAYIWEDRDHHTSEFDTDYYLQTYKNDIDLIYVAPDGSTEMGKWTLHGAFFANVNWGSVDVSSDDLVLIEATISYDWAKYQGA